MENKEKIQYHRLSTNMPIYTYKPISNYYKQSEDDNKGGNDEEEFSYKMNSLKLKSLKEKKYKKDRKLNKTFERPKIKIAKTDISINESGKKEVSLSKAENVKKKKVIIKKKIKRTNKNAATINIPTINSLRDEQEKEKEKELISNDNDENEKDIVTVNSLTDSNREDKDNKGDKNKNDGKKKKRGKGDNILAESCNIAKVPDFCGFEFEDSDSNKNSNNNDFIFDDAKKETKDKKDIKKKKKSITKKTKIIKVKKRVNQSRTNKNKVKETFKEDLADKDNNNMEINNEINKNKNRNDNKIDVKDENNKDKNDNLIKENENRKKEEEKKIIENQTKNAIRIQSLWRVYQAKKKLKRFKLVKQNIDKLFDVFNNKYKNNINCFIEQLKKIPKKSKAKPKMKKVIKKIKTGATINKGKIRELMEKEKQYDSLLIKYEEALKELEKLKKDKIYFNQNLNVIDNKNQNISINIFQNDSQNTKLYNKNDIHTIKQKRDDFIINRKIKFQILNKNQNDDNDNDHDNNLLTKKSLALAKVINNINKNIMKDFFGDYQNKANLLKFIEKCKNYEDNNKKRNMIINKVIKFSIIDNNEDNKYIDKVINKKFNDNELIINKRSKYSINKRKKEDYIITKQIKNYNVTSDKQIDTKYENYSKNINNNLIIHKVINYVIKNDVIKYENQIINYIKNNRNLIDRIKKEFNLNVKKNKEDNLVINKVNNINIKQRNKIYNNYITKNNNFMLYNNINKYKNDYIITKKNTFMLYNNMNNNKKDYIITKVISKLNIISNIKENNLVVNETNKNSKILYDDNEYISISDTINSTNNKMFKSKTEDNLIINKVINKCVIDKIICKKNNNIFNEKKLIINKINNNFTIQKLKKPEFIINKTASNNYILINHKNNDNNNNINNKDKDYVITKIHKNLKILNTKKNKDYVINKVQSNLKIIGNKEKNESDKYVIHKLISKLHFRKIKKKENVITRTVNDSIKLFEDPKNIINDEKTFINKEQSIYQIKKSKFDNNLVITKVISKLHFTTMQKDVKNQNILFISDNNHLHIKRNKEIDINNININKEDIQPSNNINELVNNKEEIDNQIKLKENDTKVDEIKKFDNKKLFISENNQLKIKRIKNKK